jgi:hypothetical protein
MSDSFELLHQSLRDLKDNTGVDILHPRGVAIHGRVYPAQEKILYHWGDSMGATATIPMENKTIVHVSAEKNFKKTTNTPKYGTIITPEKYEGAIIHRTPVAYRNTGASKHGDYHFSYDAYSYDGQSEEPSRHYWSPDSDVSHLSSVISNWSRLPSQTRNMEFPPSYPEHWKMSDEQEQQWHATGPHHVSQNSGSPIIPAHKVHFYLMDHPSVRSLGQYAYDINTEQLKTIDE